ncbi:MAG: hypothetical protein V4692_14550 [Bdellovibrionota bacterium]
MKSITGISALALVTLALVTSSAQADIFGKLRKASRLSGAATGTANNVIDDVGSLGGKYTCYIDASFNFPPFKSSKHKDRESAVQDVEAQCRRAGVTWVYCSVDSCKR